MSRRGIENHPVWTSVQVLGLMLLGPFWIPVAFTLFLLVIPLTAFRAGRRVEALGSLLWLVALVVGHSLTCWRRVEDGWFGSQLDLPYGLLTFILITGLGMMPFRLLNVMRARREGLSRPSL